MSYAYLEFHEVDALARQAVDLLVPEADLSIEQTPRNNAYVYPAATGGDHGSWRIRVTIAAGNSAVLGVESRWSAAEALANLISELSGAAHGRFRGRYFPECPGHQHPAAVEFDGGVVVFRCPVEAREVARVAPVILAS